jgi:hypothetical protein
VLICNILIVSVPVEATAFLGAVAAFVVLLLVFFLYLNKKWCFTAIGGFPCCDEPIVRPTRALALGEFINFIIFKYNFQSIVMDKNYHCL